MAAAQGTQRDIAARRPSQPSFLWIGPRILIFQVGEWSYNGSFGSSVSQPVQVKIWSKSQDAAEDVKLDVWREEDLNSDLTGDLILYAKITYRSLPVVNASVIAYIRYSGPTEEQKVTLLDDGERGKFSYNA